MRIDIPFSADIDTGLTQLNKAFAGMSPSEPPLGVNATAPPPDGTLPASRVQVIPMAPLSKWNSVVHGEPYFNTNTNTVHVRFSTTNEGSVTDLNVLFWDPHSIVGPGKADTYNP
jgi:hypothetical protein